MVFTQDRDRLLREVTETSELIEFAKRRNVDPTGLARDALADKLLGLFDVNDIIIDARLNKLHPIDTLARWLRGIRLVVTLVGFTAILGLIAGAFTYTHNLANEPRKQMEQMKEDFKKFEDLARLQQTNAAQLVADSRKIQDESIEKTTNALKRADAEVSQLKRQYFDHLSRIDISGLLTDLALLMAPPVSEFRPSSVAARSSVQRIRLMENYLESIRLAVDTAPRNADESKRLTELLSAVRYLHELGKLLSYVAGLKDANYLKLREQRVSRRRQLITLIQMQTALLETEQARLQPFDLPLPVPDTQDTENFSALVTSYLQLANGLAAYEDFVLAEAPKQKDLDKSYAHFKAAATSRFLRWQAMFNAGKAITTAADSIVASEKLTAADYDKGIHALMDARDEWERARPFAGPVVERQHYLDNNIADALYKESILRFRFCTELRGFGPQDSDEACTARRTSAELALRAYDKIQSVLHDQARAPQVAFVTASEIDCWALHLFLSGELDEDPHHPLAQKNHWLVGLPVDTEKLREPECLPGHLLINRIKSRLEKCRDRIDGIYFITFSRRDFFTNYPGFKYLVNSPTSDKKRRLLWKAFAVESELNYEALKGPDGKSRDPELKRLQEAISGHLLNAVHATLD